MKKIFALLTAMVLISSVFALNVRELGMGGSHLNDYSDVYTLQRNPAGLAFAKNTFMMLPVQLNFGGPLEDIYAIAVPYANGEKEFDQNGMISDVSDMISKNGLNMGLEIGAPLSFAFIAGGFGLGLFEDAYMDIDAPSLTVAKAEFGVKTSAVIGFAKSFGFSNVLDFSAGITAEPYVKVPVASYQGSMMDLMTALSGGNEAGMENLMKKVDVSSRAGLSVNLGAQLRALSIVEASVVVQDLVNVEVVGGKLGLSDVMDDPENLLQLADFAFDEAKPTTGNTKIKVGLAAQIPFISDITFGLISSARVYIDHDDFLALADSTAVVNPVLGFNMGAEVVLFKTISARLGINQGYFSAGAGLKLACFQFDAAIYGKELGTEPGAKPQLNVAFGTSIVF